MENGLPVFKKLNIELPHDSVIPFLGIHAKKLETGVQTKTCTQMFIEALFTVAKKWKQTKCPSVDEWVNKTCHIPTKNFIQP